MDRRKQITRFIITLNNTQFQYKFKQIESTQYDFFKS